LQVAGTRDAGERKKQNHVKFINLQTKERKTMKRNLMICDRCGADDFSGRTALMRFAKLTVVGGNVDADDHGGTVEFDLCEDCVTELDGWINNKKPQERKPR
jgi:hypothetical protein